MGIFEIGRWLASAACEGHMRASLDSDLKCSVTLRHCLGVSNSDTRPQHIHIHFVGLLLFSKGGFICFHSNDDYTKSSSQLNFHMQ